MFDKISITLNSKQMHNGVFKHWIKELLNRKMNADGIKCIIYILVPINLL